MAENAVSVSEFLKNQAARSTCILATVQEYEPDKSLIRISPCDRDPHNMNCLCPGFVVAASTIDRLVPTGRYGLCCGQRLEIVEVIFKENATVSIATFLEHVVKAPAPARPHPQNELCYWADDGCLWCSEDGKNWYRRRCITSQQSTAAAAMAPARPAIAAAPAGAVHTTDMMAVACYGGYRDPLTGQFSWQPMPAGR